MRHQAGDGVGSNHRVGVDADENFFVGRCVRDRNSDASALPELGLVRIRTWPEACSAGNAARATSRVRSVEPSSMTITRRLGYCESERGADGALDDFFFVVGGDKHGDSGLVCGDFVRAGHTNMVRSAHAVIDGEDADKKQTAGHEYVAEDENPGDEPNASIE